MHEYFSSRQTLPGKEQYSTLGTVSCVYKLMLGSSEILTFCSNFDKTTT